jgi:tetratricopeptide (TPR) repeat protein
MIVKEMRGVRGAALAVVLMIAGPGAVWAQSSDTAAPPDGPDAKAMVEEALIKLEQGDVQEAGRLFQEASRIRPDLDKLKLLEGLLHIELNHAAEALPKLEEYNKSPEGKLDYRGFQAVGRVYLQSLMYRQATPSLEKAKGLAPIRDPVRNKPIKALIAMDLAGAYLGLDRTKQAVKVAKEAVEAAPKDADIQLRFSEIVANAGDFELAATASDRAIVLFKGEIRDKPFSKDAHTKLQRALNVSYVLHDHHREKEPNDGEHYYGLARVLRQKAALDRRVTLLSALELANQAIERAADRVDWQLFAVQLEMDLGGLAQARERLTEIIARHPNNAEAIRLKEQLDAAPAPLILQ